MSTNANALVRDPEELAEEQRRRAAVYAAARTPAPAPVTRDNTVTAADMPTIPGRITPPPTLPTTGSRRPAEPSGETAEISSTPSSQPGTLPNIAGGAPSAPGLAAAPVTAAPKEKTLADQIAERRAELKQKLHPERAPTALGRFGHTMNVIGQDIGMALEPNIMERIPGTIASNRAELQRLTEMEGQERGREATAETERARTEIERQKAETERQKAGLWHQLPPGDETVKTVGRDIFYLWEKAGQPAQWAKEGTMPQDATLPNTQTAATATTPAAAPTAPPGTPAPTTPPPGQAPPTPGGAPTSEPVTRYGKPPVPLTEQERQQANAEFGTSYGNLNNGAKLPPAYELKPGATKEDYDRVAKQLGSLETTSGVAEARKFNQQMALDREQRAREEEARRKEAASGEWLRAVGNDGKVHYVTRGDYDAHPRDFHPNPGTLPKGEMDKVVDHNTVLNEMQGRMNAVAESARNFNWNDPQEQRFVIQAMGQVEGAYPDKLIGIPIMDYVAQNLKQLGLKGAAPATREYIIDLLSLREAMLGMPKEITGGSRMMEKSIEALYSTLPSGTTPDLAYAMMQLRTTQGIMNRLRGSRVPIMDGMQTTDKIPDLYQHSLTNPKTGQTIYSDDGKEWVDEDGKPVTGRK